MAKFIPNWNCHYWVSQQTELTQSKTPPTAITDSIILSKGTWRINLAFQPTFLRFIFGGAIISSAKCYLFVPGYLTLCLSVSANVSYILRLCKGYLPGTRGYVIYSPGTAPRATYKKLFLFRFSKAMQQKIAFS